MAGNRSQALENFQEDHDRTEVREHHSTAPAVETASSGREYASRDGRSSAGPIYHTAFMQCRACCNCHAECSYYGRGHFDSRGNYIGPWKPSPILYVSSKFTYRSSWFLVPDKDQHEHFLDSWHQTLDSAFLSVHQIDSPCHAPNPSNNVGGHGSPRNTPPARTPMTGPKKAKGATRLDGNRWIRTNHVG